MIQPDAPTIDRLKNLAIVGTAIKEAYSEENQDFGGGELVLAKSALDRFKEGIQQLELEPQDMQGMMDLVDYLNKKLDKRLNGGLSSN